MKGKCYWWIEGAIDRLVPIAVLLLLVIILLEFFGGEFTETYRLYIDIADYIVLGIFVLDLFFKYLRARSFKDFMKNSWLDIIAIFPFFLVFRVFESFLIVAELPQRVNQFQLLLHTGTEISQETAKIIQEAEEAGKISRVKTILRMFRGLEDSPRIIKAIAFYEHPAGRHHLYEVPGKKEYKKIKKGVEKEVKIIEKDAEKIEKEIENIPRPKRAKKKK
ncbi:hypothetical protein HZA98_00135 [Candidatus Woesearchaeota archaeon]|nr:hypothetical protein [Candidatus Woesearchaeota archaeon]